MIKAIDFIKWALSHAHRESIPDGAELPLPLSECGTEPWHYLFGTIKTHTTPAKIAERWENFYSRKGWSPEQYHYATKDMQPGDYATDCAGLLDAYLTETIGKTDNNANGYYRDCSDRGKISSVKRPYVLGELVFMANRIGRMHHIGFVCGLEADGKPLVVEARGLSYGVVITRFKDRAWTHRGLLKKYFSYESGVPYPDEKTNIVFELSSPMMRGTAVKALQIMLNEAGYRDADGNALTADGKLGRRSYEAFDKFLAAHTAPVESEPLPFMPGEFPVKQIINGIVYTGTLTAKVDEESPGEGTAVYNNN